MFLGHNIVFYSGIAFQRQGVCLVRGSWVPLSEGVCSCCQLWMGMSSYTLTKMCFFFLYAEEGTFFNCSKFFRGVSFFRKGYDFFRYARVCVFLSSLLELELLGLLPGEDLPAEVAVGGRLHEENKNKYLYLGISMSKLFFLTCWKMGVFRLRSLTMRPGRNAV